MPPLMQHKRIFALSLAPMLCLGFVVAIAASGASAGRPDCPGNSCHGNGTTTTSSTTTSNTTTTAATPAAQTTTTASTTTATTATTTTTTTTGTSSPQRLYWGAWIGKQFTGTEAPWSWTAVQDFQAADSGSKPVSVVHWSSPFVSSYCSGSGGTCSFGTTTFESVRSHGVIPFFSWANSGIADRDVAAGKYDSYITAWAQSAKAWGHPFFLRFSWEMNGSWFSWGVGSNGNTAADYVAMWRHVHNIFTNVGATNATWVWCPNVDPGGKFASLASLYPGDAYVDWTCLDGYNGNNPWTSFRNLFATTYDLITGQIAPSKPMIVGEVGSTESGGSKSQWIADMFSSLPSRFPHIRGLVWFDKNQSGPGGQTDWPIESSSSSSAAFAAGVASTSFTSNTFATLGSTAIAAP